MSHRKKLARAATHIQALREIIDAYVVSYPYRINAFYTPTPMVVGQRTDATFILDIRIPPPDDVPVLIGDCVTNMRASLDHLIFALAQKHSGRIKKPKVVKFPIERDPQKYPQQAKSSLAEVSPAVQLAIQALQPFPALAPNRSRTALALLNELVNVDKHQRILTVPTVKLNRSVVSISDDSQCNLAFKDHKEIFRDGDTVASAVLIPLNSDTEVWFNTVDIDLCTLHQESGKHVPVVLMLESIHDYIRDVVFTKLEPHLV